MNSGSTYYFQLDLPQWVSIKDRKLSREDFYALLWSEFGEEGGLVGIDEGTMLAEEAFEQGFETESFTIDSALAPRERDWLSHQAIEKATLYFSTQKLAEKASAALSLDTKLVISSVKEQKNQDWDAEWKASFKGIDLPPYWKVIPPWEKLEQSRDQAQIPYSIILNPGAGFGTGTHETTQLCLTELAKVFQKNNEEKNPVKKVFDFGSGSGILTIAAALLGAEAIGVEIDPLANDNANENAKLNQVQEHARFYLETPSDCGVFDVVCANILRPVLIEFSSLICSKLDSVSTLILSGLVQEDVEIISNHYGNLLKVQPTVYSKNEWRCLVFNRG